MPPYYLSLLLLLLHLINSIFNYAFATPTPSPAPSATATPCIPAPISTPSPAPSSTITPVPSPNAAPIANAHIPTPNASPIASARMPTPITTTTTPIQTHNITTAPLTGIPTLNISAAAPPPPRVRGINRQQLNNIIDALIGAGDFNRWANILSVADPSSLPLSATLFVPADDSRSPISTAITFDPLIFPYHIVPQRLCFAELRQMKLYTRLPTLLLSKSILITNNSISNYTLDDSLLSHPDLFTTGTFAVHGMGTLLDYNVYGDAKPKAPQPEVLSRPPPATYEPSGEEIDDNPDSPDVDAACLCTEVWPVFLVFCAVLASKFQRMSLGR
ncbi:receptor-like protein 51 [Manihot esculenta]|uniref:FAS1 domain-containing protein n=1 Tax=Manihot esculenta TaxID=3983 RepID=A0A2C9W588_MANES|nr:receptor-like protein 51 [Manihot esculenta]OAY54337.1 hypothetical protein MANES_03G066900v8 [Manihot esculenta]